MNGDEKAATLNKKIEELDEKIEQLEVVLAGMYVCIYVCMYVCMLLFIASPLSSRFLLALEKFFGLQMLDVIEATTGLQLYMKIGETCEGICMSTCPSVCSHNPS